MQLNVRASFSVWGRCLVIPIFLPVVLVAVKSVCCKTRKTSWSRNSLDFGQNNLVVTPAGGMSSTGQRNGRVDAQQGTTEEKGKLARNFPSKEKQEASKRGGRLVLFF